MALEFHSRMRVLSNKVIEEVSNKPINEEVDDMETGRRARALADRIIAWILTRRGSSLKILFFLILKDMMARISQELF